MINATSLTKRFGDTTAVDGLTFTVEPGQVTGFLGPNGAGKSTTMRMIVGLDRPTEGDVTVNGQHYRDLAAPLHEVGVLLDGRAAHPGRTARNHLRGLAATHGISAARVDEVMALTGLQSVARKRVGGFSLGMGQRLGIAAALLGDPETIILDEPINGLDPDGILWIRALLRRLAAEGRTVLLSSHLMDEMRQTADHLIVLGRGRLLAQGPLDEVIASTTETVVRVRTREGDRLAAALAQPDVTVTTTHDGAVEVAGLTAEQVADTAAAHGISLYEVRTVEGSLEDAYLALTGAAVQYRSAGSSSTEPTTDSTATTTKGAHA